LKSIFGNKGGRHEDYIKKTRNKEERYRSYKTLAILRVKTAFDTFPGKEMIRFVKCGDKII